MEQFVYKIEKNIPKPDNLPAKRGGGVKYPLADMAVGDSFVVPCAEQKPGEPPEPFRNRVYQSCRNYALRERTAAGEKKGFTVAIMSEDDASEAKRFVKGDVVVWRDR